MKTVSSIGSRFTVALEKAGNSFPTFFRRRMADRHESGICQQLIAFFRQASVTAVGKVFQQGRLDEATGERTPENPPDGTAFHLSRPRTLRFQKGNFTHVGPTYSMLTFWQWLAGLKSSLLGETYYGLDPQAYDRLFDEENCEHHARQTTDNVGYRFR